MKRIIIDYKKLTPEILNLLVKKFPDGYGDRDIITFDNHHNETINAVEVTAEDAIYLVIVESKLHYSILNHDSIFKDDDDSDKIIEITPPSLAEEDL
jgi:hypothetical protein